MTIDSSNQREFPYEGIPEGWYQVAWSNEIEPGAVIPLRYFGTDLVLYRLETGELRLTGAYCPHMGAHLGYGGRVDGTDIVCPYHAWRFDSDGRNCEVPYADGPNRTRLHQWSVTEEATIVSAWYSPDGSSPKWDPISIPEYSRADEYAVADDLRARWETLNMKPQYAAENLVDPAHQKYVHRSNSVPVLQGVEAEGPVFRVRTEIRFGEGKSSTWLTPDGVPVTGHIDAEAWGLGNLLGRFDIDGSLTLQTFTPIDADTCDSRLTVIVRNSDMVDGSPSEDAIRRFKHSCKQFERDLVIWEHMEYRTPNPLAPPEVGPFRQFRSWSTKFYPDADPERFGRRKEPRVEVRAVG